MATVRKRTWTSSGKKKTAWVAAYPGQQGKRHIKSFERKKDAEDWLSSAQVEVKRGAHTPDHGSATVAAASELWLADCVAIKRIAPGTLAGYRDHVQRYIVPRLGDKKLSRLRTSDITDFVRGVARDTSPKTARRLLYVLRSILKVAQKSGWVAQNVALSADPPPKQDDGKVGITMAIPTPEEVAQLLAGASPSFQPMLMAAVFTGMRWGELRALLWEDVHFDRGVIVVNRQPMFSTIFAHQRLPQACARSRCPQHWSGRCASGSWYAHALAAFPALIPPRPRCCSWQSLSRLTRRLART